MFSKLLDRKIKEAKNQNPSEDNSDDIEEDYMKAFIKPGTSVSTASLNDVS